MKPQQIRDALDISRQRTTLLEELEAIDAEFGLIRNEYQTRRQQLLTQLRTIKPGTPGPAVKTASPPPEQDQTPITAHVAKTSGK